jgi:hypothetical protein
MINFDMPAFGRKRESFMQLRDRHLQWVEELGIRKYYDRSTMQDFFVENYDRYFGCLRRSKAKAVPSDLLRKEIMISMLLDLVDGRRAEYAAERAAYQF